MEVGLYLKILNNTEKSVCPIEEPEILHVIDYFDGNKIGNLIYSVQANFILIVVIKYTYVNFLAPLILMF